MPNLTPQVCPQLDIISTFGILFRILTPHYWAHYSRYDCWARLSRPGELHVDPDEKWTVRRLFITADGDGRSVAEPSIASSLRVNWPIVVIYDRTTRMPQGVTPRRFTPSADAYFPPLLPSVRRLSAVSGGVSIRRPSDGHTVRSERPNGREQGGEDVKTESTVELYSAEAAQFGLLLSETEKRSSDGRLLSGDTVAGSIAPRLLTLFSAFIPDRCTSKPTKETRGRFGRNGTRLRRNSSDCIPI